MGRQPKPNPLAKPVPPEQPTAVDRGFEAAATNAVERAAAAALDAQLRRAPEGTGLVASREHYRTVVA